MFKQYNIYSVPIISFGLYIMYYVFGVNNNYLYPKFDKLNILINSLYLLIIVFLINLIISYTLNKVSKKISTLINIIILSYLSFLTLSFLLKFAGFNYAYFFYLKTEGVISVKYLYFFIVLFFFLILILFGKKFRINYSRFLFYLIIFLSSFTLIRLLDIDIDKNYSNDYKNYIPESENLNVENFSNKKAVLLIFDEFDFGVLEKNLELLPVLKNLSLSSFYHKNFYSNRKDTLDSIPEILSGKYNLGTSFKDGDLYFKTKENKKIKFNEKNSIFGDVKEKNLQSEIYGEYHPYCKIFKVRKCYDVFNFKLHKSDLFEAIHILTIQLYLNSILTIDSYKLIEFLRDKYYILINKSEIKNVIEKKYESGDIITEESAVMFNNSKNFVSSDSDFVYIHYPYPHLGTEVYFEEGDYRNNLDKYVVNLILVNNTLDNILNTLKSKDGVLIIITTDHWLRKGEEINKTVFISKIIGDKNSFIGLKKNDTTKIRELINNYFSNLINTNEDIYNFFEK